MFRPLILAIFRVAAKTFTCKGKAVPSHSQSDPECSRKLRYPVFMTRFRVVVRLPALRPDHLYPSKCFWYTFLVRGFSPIPPPQVFEV
jgi:hypothetical protein